MRRYLVYGALAAFVLSCAQRTTPTAGPVSAAPAGASGLRPLAAFEKIEDDEQRALALFAEVGKVLLHPRCVNCHPNTERPLQGENGLPHQPLVIRGEDGHGAPALRCQSCHGAENFENVPGNPKWHLAPASMAWEGKSLGAICEQIMDEDRNGGMDHEELKKHMAEDPLVAYGWNPPAHLEPAPGDQRTVGALFAAWIDAGAHCPTP